ncbi:MAG: disulfide oxidoreductase [Acidimicrobiia bacterium]|nr:disulfide oxidoreductase [Acidimicrobiia bacterium]
MSPQNVDFYNTLLAMLSLAALAAAVGLVGYRIAAGAEAARNLLGGSAIWLAWTVAAVATSGSLIYSEVIHFVPCRLCWFQRIAMYPMAVVLLVGAIRREVVVKYYALPLALGGALISIWHYLTQVFPSLEGGSCDPVNPCSSKYVDVFGFVSIPFMAGTGFIVIAVLLAFYVRTNNE